MGTAEVRRPLLLLILVLDPDKLHADNISHHHVVCLFVWECWSFFSTRSGTCTMTNLRIFQYYAISSILGRCASRKITGSLVPRTRYLDRSSSETTSANVRLCVFYQHPRECRSQTITHYARNNLQWAETAKSFISKFTALPRALNKSHFLKLICILYLHN
jgi:hypothetical protein